MDPSGLASSGAAICVYIKRIDIILPAQQLLFATGPLIYCVIKKRRDENNAAAPPGVVIHGIPCCWTINYEQWRRLMDLSLYFAYSARCRAQILALLLLSRRLPGGGRGDLLPGPFRAQAPLLHLRLGRLFHPHR